jgi:hypothetical protein
VGHTHGAARVVRVPAALTSWSSLEYQHAQAVLMGAERCGHRRVARSDDDNVGRLVCH